MSLKEQSTKKATKKDTLSSLALNSQLTAMMLAAPWKGTGTGLQPTARKDPRPTNDDLSVPEAPPEGSFVAPPTKPRDICTAANTLTIAIRETLS